MIQAMIFDMDGILFDTERILKEGWMDTAEKMGFSLGEEELRQMRGGSAAWGTALFEKWFGAESIIWKPVPCAPGIWKTTWLTILFLKKRD